MVKAPRSMLTTSRTNAVTHSASCAAAPSVTMPCAWSTASPSSRGISNCMPAARKVATRAMATCHGWRRAMRVIRSSVSTPLPHPAAVTWANARSRSMALRVSVVTGLSRQYLFDTGARFGGAAWAQGCRANSPRHECAFWQQVQGPQPRVHAGSLEKGRPWQVSRRVGRWSGLCRSAATGKRLVGIQPVAVRLALGGALGEPPIIGDLAQMRFLGALPVFETPPLRATILLPQEIGRSPDGLGEFRILQHDPPHRDNAGWGAELRPISP